MVALNHFEVWTFQGLIHVIYIHLRGTCNVQATNVRSTQSLLRQASPFSACQDSWSVCEKHPKSTIIPLKVLPSLHVAVADELIECTYGFFHLLSWWVHFMQVLASLTIRNPLIKLKLFDSKPDSIINYIKYTWSNRPTLALSTVTCSFALCVFSFSTWGCISLQKMSRSFADLIWIEAVKLGPSREENWRGSTHGEWDAIVFSIVHRWGDWIKWKAPLNQKGNYLTPTTNVNRSEDHRDTKKYVLKVFYYYLFFWILRNLYEANCKAVKLEPLRPWHGGTLCFHRGGFWNRGGCPSQSLWKDAHISAPNCDKENGWRGTFSSGWCIYIYINKRLLLYRLIECINHKMFVIKALFFSFGSTQLKIMINHEQLRFPKINSQDLPIQPWSQQPQVSFLRL